MNSIEKKFLIYNSQLHINTCQKKWISDSIARVNFDRVISMALNNNTASLLYYNLREPNLKKYYENTIVKNIMFEEELKRLVDVLKKKGVDVLVLKGMALLKLVYQRTGIRNMDDIDILVRHNDVEKAYNILTNSGYFPLPFYNKKWLVKNYMALSFKHNEGYHIELHSDLINKNWYRKITNMDIGEVWGNSITLNFGDIKIKTLCLEDTIIHLCVHLLTSHSMKGLIWFCDINELVKKYWNEIKWDTLLFKAERYKVKNVLYIVLFYTACLFENNALKDKFLNIKFKHKKFYDALVLQDKEVSYVLCSLFAISDLFDKLKAVFHFLFAKRYDSYFKSAVHFFCSATKVFFNTVKYVIRYRLI